MEEGCGKREKNSISSVANNVKTVLDYISWKCWFLQLQSLLLKVWS